jgi:choline dehydrogenase-like flavoprotein
MPSIVSGNTMATVYGIAERAASVMREGRRAARLPTSVSA